MGKTIEDIFRIVLLLINDTDKEAELLHAYIKHLEQVLDQRKIYAVAKEVIWL